MRPQVCGRGAAARGAAIFGDFGAAGETASQAVLSPPAAGPESPAGREAEVTDGGHGARSSPYLVKEAVDWPAKQRGGGGAAPASRRELGGGWWRSLPTPPPALHASQRLRCSVPDRTARIGGVGACGPRGTVVAGSGVMQRWMPGLGGEGCLPPGKHHWEPGVSGRDGRRPQVEPGLPAWREGCGRTTLCTEIFLFCNWATRGLPKVTSGLCSWKLRAAPTPPEAGEGQTSLGEEGADVASRTP